MSRKSLLRGVAALAIGLVVAALVAELALRIYNPVPLRLRGKDIVLPANATIRMDAGGVPGLDPVIVVHRNSLGLRGEEPPVDPTGVLRIFCVGGSTTECARLSDGKTWPDLLLAEVRRHLAGCWLNNAGLDGHSTFGHIHLIDQVLAEQRPDYLVFLVGLNDVDRDDANIFDLGVRVEQQSFLRRLIRSSELLATVQALHRVWRARDLGVGHIWRLDLAKTPRGHDDADEVAACMRRQEEACLPRYRERLRRLVAMTRACGAEPVFVTQPALYGDGIDPYTGVALGELLFGERTAALTWRLIEAFNAATRDVGRAEDVFVVELADRLPKDSRLFYDWTHYTNAGAERVAAIVAEQLVPWLAKRHPDRVLRR